MIYTLQINIHQIDPDLVQYTLLIDDSEVPPVEKPWKTVLNDGSVIPLGFLHPNKSDKDLALIASDGTKDDFKLYKENNAEWIVGEEVPDDFPRTEFSTLNYSSVFSDRLTVISSLQSVWATEDALYWANLASTTDSLPTIKGAIAFNYDNEIWLIGGSILDGSGVKTGNNFTVYYSMDGGLVWKAKESQADTPVPLDINTDDVVVKDAYFYIITPTQTWKAAVNSQLFDH